MGYIYDDDGEKTNATFLNIFWLMRERRVKIYCWGQYLYTKNTIQQQPAKERKKAINEEKKRQKSGLI